MALLTTTLQAWFSEAGLSLKYIGMLSLLGLPYLYRVLWVPFLDRYSLTPLGKRRSWMILTQLLLLAGFVYISCFSPRMEPETMMSIAFILACVAATQDMAIEAHRSEYLQSNEQGIGASMAVFGYRMAVLVSGGLALVFAQHLGFPKVYQLMGFLMLIGAFASYFSNEPSKKEVQVQHISDSFIKPLKEFYARKGIVSLLMFVLLYKFAEAFTSNTSGILIPFLIQGLGFSSETVGYVNKIGGLVAVILGGLAAGFIMLRLSMFKALLIFGLLQAITNFLFVMLAIKGQSIPFLVLAVVFDNFVVGMSTTAIVAMFMRVVDKRFTATQFSILTSLGALPRVFSGPLGASLQAKFGWIGLYQISVVFALFFIPFLYQIRHLIMDDSESESSTQDLVKADSHLGHIE